jgi:hypothetical protein
VLANPIRDVGDLEEDLGQQGVPAGGDAPQRELCEQTNAISAEPGGAIRAWQSREQPDIAVGCHAQQKPPEFPVEHPYTAVVARANHDFGVVESRHQRGNVFWIMREIRIEGHDDVVAPVDALVQPTEDRRAVAPLVGLAADDTHAGSVARQLLDECRRSIGRRIIDDEDVRRRKRGANRRDQTNDVVGLVVRRDDGQNPQGILRTEAGSS